MPEKLQINWVPKLNEISRLNTLEKRNNDKWNLMKSLHFIDFIKTDF